MILGALLVIGIITIILMITSNYFLYRYSWVFLIIIFLSFIFGDIHDITSKGMNIAITIGVIFLAIKIAESLGKRSADITFNQLSKSITITTSDSTIITSDSLIIIDETQAALFLCNKMDTSVYAISRSNIKSIHYK